VVPVGSGPSRSKESVTLSSHPLRRGPQEDGTGRGEHDEVKQYMPVDVFCSRADV
jgi:hypothetical protein